MEGGRCLAICKEISWENEEEEAVCVLVCKCVCVKMWVYGCWCVCMSCVQIEARMKKEE